jgi:hypothetical protein
MEQLWEPAHSMWGVSLDQYVAEWTPRRPPAKRPTSRAVSESLELLRTGYPSCSTFEFLLSLADRPRQLRSFLGDGLIPGCMRLLREYRQAHSVCDHTP